MRRRRTLGDPKKKKKRKIVRSLIETITPQNVQGSFLLIAQPTTCNDYRLGEKDAWHFTQWYKYELEE